MAGPRFSSGPVLESENGAALLEWEHDDEDGEYEVERTDEGADESIVVYRGTMPSAHVSGLPQGRYRFRVRAKAASGWSVWSAPVELRVQHHPMALVWILFGLGAAVFVATAGFLLRQARRDRA